MASLQYEVAPKLSGSAVMDHWWKCCVAQHLIKTHSHHPDLFSGYAELFGLSLSLLNQAPRAIIVTTCTKEY
jgi:hypothetical protein